MSMIYGAILDEIEWADYQVYRGRVKVLFTRKVWLAVKSYFSKDNTLRLLLWPGFQGGRRGLRDDLAQGLRKVRDFT